MFLLIVVAILGGLYTYILNGLHKDPDVCLTIDSYDGLPRNESNTVFSPEFNLTLYGKEGNNLRWASDALCYRDGFIGIWYQGFSVASGYIRDSCLGAWNGHTMTLFAWGKQVEMPLHLENRLCDEAEHGTAVLDMDIELLVQCHSSKVCGMCSFSCWLLIGYKGYSQCQLTEMQKDPYSFVFD